MSFTSKPTAITSNINLIMVHNLFRLSDNVIIAKLWFIVNQNKNAPAAAKPLQGL
jgi:hypothetical protein